MRLFFLLCVLVSVGCSANRASPAQSQATPVQDDCTLDTPLQPGIPGSPDHPIPSDVNPNGMSQLAVLMRTMMDDLKTARVAVETNQSSPQMWTRHRNIRCSWPTKPQDRNPQFDAMAVAYLAAIKALEAQPQDRKAAYNTAVQACLACHAQACPGPVEIIEPLLVP